MSVETYADMIARTTASVTDPADLRTCCIRLAGQVDQLESLVDCLNSIAEQQEALITRLMDGPQPPKLRLVNEYVVKLTINLTVNTDGDMEWECFCIAVTAKDRSEAAVKARAFAKSRWKAEWVQVEAVESYADVVAQVGSTALACDHDLRLESSPNLN